MRELKFGGLGLEMADLLLQVGDGFLQGRQLVEKNFNLLVKRQERYGVFLDVNAVIRHCFLSINKLSFATVCARSTSIRVLRASQSCHNK